MAHLLHPELSYRITGLCFRVQQELGRYCRERQYADRLEELLKLDGLRYQREHDLSKYNDASPQGNRVDFLIEDTIVLDCKAKSYIIKEDYTQMQRYLRGANCELGLVVNFRQPHLKPKRILNTAMHSDAANLRIIRMSHSDHSDRHSGFTLLELLVALGIIALVVVTVIGLLGRSIEVLRREEHRRVAVGIAEERLERLRNSPYDDLGTIGGIPSGAFSPREIIQRNGAQYDVATRIRFVDDPFDDVAPNDPVPNDLRELAVDVAWGANPSQTITLATLAAPPGLERAGTTGTLRLRVLDAHGNPVEGANVELANANITPPIALALPSDANGEVILPGAPASTAGYHVRVARSGYNTDATVAPSPDVPNPVAPPLTVIEHEVTTAGFAIDRLAAIAFTFQKYGPSQPFRNLVTFTLQGQKMIGSRPNPTPPPEALPVYKASPESFTTNQGALTISNLEWDTYELMETMAEYDIAVTDPPLPIELLPGTTQNVLIMFAPHHDHSLHIIIRDAGGMPVPDAVVTLIYADSPQRTKTETTPAHGQIFLSPLWPGTATLTAAKDGFETTTRELTISGTMEVEVRLQRL